MNDPKPGIFKIVNGQDLEQHTNMGWQLVERFPEGSLQSVSDTIPVAGANGSYPTMMSGSHGVVVRNSVFLIWKSEESAIAIKSGEITNLNKLLTEAREQKTAADNELKELQATLASTQRAFEALKADLKRLQDKEAAWKDVTTQIDQLKTDFGKIWGAIGDLRMREILGANAKNPKPLPESERRTVYDHIQQAELDEGDGGS